MREGTSERDKRDKRDMRKVNLKNCQNNSNLFYGDGAPQRFEFFKLIHTL